MIRLRPAEPQDSWTYWTFRNDPQAIENSINRTGPISWEAHQEWWNNTFEHRFVAYDGPVLVGILRISPEGLLSIIVAPGERGKGLGTQMLTSIKRIAAELGLKSLKAEALSYNEPSQKAFIKASWKPTKFEVDLLREQP